MVKKSTEIVKKTDIAIKSAESYWSFGKLLWEAKGAITPILAIGGIVTAALLDMFSALAAFGWAAWVLTGVPIVFLSALFWFALSWLWHNRAIRNPPPEVSGNISPALEQVGGKPDNDPITDDELSIAAYIEGELQDLVSQVEGKIDATNSKIEILNSHMATNFGAVAQMHHAQASLQVFDPLSEKIKISAKELSDLPMSENWHECFGQWTAWIEHWGTFSSEFCPNRYKDILHVDSELFQSRNWSADVNEIANPDDQLAYKKFRIQLRNFEEQLDMVSTAINYQAWNTFSGQGTEAKYITRFKY